MLPGLIGVSLGRRPTGITTQLSEGFEPVRKAPIAGIAAVVVGVAIWIMAFQDVIDGWTFLAAMVALLAVLPAVAAAAGARRPRRRRIPVFVLAVLVVAGALVVPWADLSDSNGWRFTALLAYGVFLGVAASGLAGVLDLGEDDEPSPDLVGITTPLDRSVAVEAETVIGITEEDLVGAP